MIAAGFANCLTTLSWANASVPQTFGQAIDLVAPVLFVHVFLAYPSGRLHSRVERMIVVLGYAAAIGLEVVRMTLGEFGSKNLLELRAILTRPTCCAMCSF
jgi:hypothetical protein